MLTTPTTGFNKQNVMISMQPELTLSICELGSPLLPSFPKYVEKSRAIVFIVDLSDEASLVDSAGWFSAVLDEVKCENEGQWDHQM